MTEFIPYLHQFTKLKKLTFLGVSVLLHYASLQSMFGTRLLGLLACLFCILQSGGDYPTDSERHKLPPSQFGDRTHELQDRKLSLIYSYCSLQTAMNGEAFIRFLVSSTSLEELTIDGDLILQTLEDDLSFRSLRKLTVNVCNCCRYERCARLYTNAVGIRTSLFVRRYHCYTASVVYTPLHIIKQTISQK